MDKMGIKIDKAQLVREWIRASGNRCKEEMVWLFANESEAAQLTGMADFDDQMLDLGKQFTHVVIKRGRFGAVLGGRNGTSISRSAPLVDVVDTTGAGDAFAAGFIASLMKGESHEICLEAGIAGGARAVQFVGGQPE